MSSGIEDSREQIINFIMGTPEYLDYQRHRENLRRYPELHDKANRIRLENFRILENVSREDLLDEYDRFMEQYEEDYSITAIHDYLESEAAFCMLMQSIMDDVMEDINF
ncbi:MAG: YlbF family regulator [Lachnospiraceae bacterium]|nr:YlbF family regulator [Lachnospiraceae bacterium]